MIVRCNNCNSAFAVDDEKVADKKFAFTCPRCSTENIIDNRVSEKYPEAKKVQPEESFFNDDFSIDTESPVSEAEEFNAPDDLFSEEIPSETPSGEEESFALSEDEFPSDFLSDEQTEKPVKKERKLNLEIEESADFPELDEDIFSEKTPAVKKTSRDTDDFISFDENEIPEAAVDEFGIELKEDLITAGDEDNLFDDFEEKEDKKKTSSEEESEFIFDEMETELEAKAPASDREKKLSSQDDIDALFAEEGIDFDEKPISKQGEIDFEDEITVDLDMLDIDLEEATESRKTEGKTAPSELSEEISFDSDIFAEPSETGKKKAEADDSEEDITLDIDSLDIDLEETPSDTDIFGEPAKTGKQKTKPDESEEDITLDIDSLDIDLEETPSDTDIFGEPAKTGKQKTKTEESEDDITLDIDNLDIDLEESPFETDIFAEPVRSEKKIAKPIESEDDITLDIEGLDIELDEGIAEKPLEIKAARAVSKKQIPAEEEEFDEEDIKLNLDDLDIDLAEIEERDLIFEDDLAEEPAPVKVKKPRAIIEESDEDESITIDLDSLEIEIAEENNVIKSELPEDDEKLTLDDAGLTFDELTSQTEKSEIDETADEDLKLTLDEIDPELTLDRISRSAKIETERVSDSLDELPEIDLDEYDAIVREEESRVSARDADHFEDDFVLFPESETERALQPDYDMFDYHEADLEKTAPEKGNTFFSIDLSLKYSRIGALLRLLGLYVLSMIPHLIVMLIYTVLSSVVGFINQIVILSTGRCVEDFALVIENTTRYFFYIETNITGIVEDRPVYAGREHIDHPLQLNITFPLKYSKNMAFLRLSIIGILLITLPHLIIMSLITVTIPFVYLTGILSVIFTRRWPNVLFIYLTKYFRYLARISSFLTGLTDEYPPFSFD